MKAVLLVALFAAVFAQRQTKNQYINDNNVLNYALTLENLESQFYAQGLAKFNSDANFTAAGYPSGTYDLLTFISGQEAGHANALTSVLQSRGWPAVAPCTYNFTVAYVDVRTFMQYVANIEGTGTSAYDGAAGALTDVNLLTIAAGIATVEARHTSAIQLLFNNTAASSFPFAFEPTLTETEVFNRVAPFFVSCNPVTANVAYYGSYTVDSTQPKTYTWQSAVSLRGGSNDNDDNFYYSNSALATADVSILQYALFLENLENNFYSTYAISYNTSAAITADPLYAGVSATAAGIISNSIQAVANHEAVHVATLNSIISGYKFTPAAPCPNYNWTVFGLPAVPTAGNPTFSQFLNVSLMLENVGVRAYVGAIALISNSITAQTAATIATIEGRHAAYIASILFKAPPVYKGTRAFPTGADGANLARDLPVIPSDTYNIIQPIIGTCAATNNANPAPFIGSNTLAFNFFSDKVGPSAPPTATDGFSPSAGAATVTGTGTNNAGTGTGTGTNNAGTGTGTNNAGTGTGTSSTPRSGSASAVVASFALLAIVLALF